VTSKCIQSEEKVQLSTNAVRGNGCSKNVILFCHWLHYVISIICAL